MKSIDRIAKEYGPRLYAHIRRMVVRHEDADDILQNTYVKAWQKIKSFRGEAKLSTWLFRIATNEALDHLRKEKRRRNIPLEDAPVWLQAEQNQAFAPDTEESIKLFHQAVLQLPERQQTVFNLKYFEEMTYEEISVVTNVTVGALKASYHHAVKKIEASVLNALNPSPIISSK